MQVKELQITDSPEYMPLNSKDEAWIKHEIEESFKRHRRGKIVHFVRDWGGLGGIIAIGIFVLYQWSNYVEFRTKTSDRLDAIESKDLPGLAKRLENIDDNLKKLNGSVASLQVERFVSLPKKEFQSSLPQLKSSIQFAKQKDIRIPSATMNELQRKLLQVDKNAADFWPTASSFISYRSVIVIPEDILGLLSGELPSCVNSEPSPMKVAEVLSPYTIRVSRAYYQTCKVTLDSSQDDERINNILHRFPLLTFKHCLIAYHGGPVNLILAWNNAMLTFGIGEDINKPEKMFSAPISGNALEFENCLFNFEIERVLSPEGKQMTETLLAQSTPTLKLP